MELTVPPEQSGQALLAFVASRLIAHSKTALRRRIAAGEVRVNGARSPLGRILVAGDVVSLPPDLAPADPPVQSVAIEVLYEDEDHLCVNKPAGHTVLARRSGEGAEFYESLVALLNRHAPPGGPYTRPHVVHRLDRDTSGVLLVAKDVEAGRALSMQFQRRRVDKSYLALVEGVLPRPEVGVDLPIARLRGSMLKMAPDPRHGKPAQTRVLLREPFGHFCLVEARPVTGRQHQIRVHLAAIGYPLAVDPLYGRRDALTGAELNAILGRSAARASQRLMERVPLHAASIRYQQPRSREPLCVGAPLPDDVAGLLGLLRRADPPA